MKKEFILLVTCVLFMSISVNSKELILQNGLNGYNGCTDTYLSDKSGQNENYGDESFTSLQGYHCGGCTDQRVLVKFDLTQFDKNTEVNSAKMELFVEAQPRYGPATARLYRVSSDWDEMSATWFKSNSSNWWNDEGGDFNSNMITSFDAPASATNKWQEFDITELIQDFIKNPENNYGVHLYMNVTMVTYEYVSSESSKKDKRPKLTIDYNEPTAISVVNKYSDKKLEIIKTENYLKISVPFEGNSLISVFNLNGKLISRFNIKGKNSIVKTQTSFKAGTYIIKANNGNNSIFNKFTIN